MGRSSGADATFEDFVVASQRSLIRLAVLLTGDHGHAEDLVQTALVKVHRHWRRVSERGDPTAYVRRVIVTTHTSWRRRLSSTEQVWAELPDRPGTQPPSDPVDRQLQAALLDLPARMRAAVVLRFYADLSEAQTAAVMGCSTSAVNTQTARGLVRLREALAAPPSAATHTINVGLETR